MMDSVSGVGLVLRRERHLEQDLRLTILMRDAGKVKAISKGGQRLSSKLKAIQEPFTEADFQLYLPPHGGYGRLAGGRLVHSHQNLRAHLEAFQLACRCCEVVEALLPARAPSPDVYDILRQSLQVLQTPEPHGSPLHEWVLFVVRLLKTLGHGDVSAETGRLSTEGSLTHCVAFLESELERILPWRLKSTVEVG